ncbi:MAG: transposase [Chloroflexi bacterium]|nr:transposase [Chloroflexota bacterium]
MDRLPDLIRVIINTAMQAEWQASLGAGRYDRSQERRGHANGYKGKTIKTRVGDIALAVSLAREGGFYPEALEKGLRSERALLVTLAEIYIQGVSTRKVPAIIEEMCKISVPSAAECADIGNAQGYAE